MNISLQSSSGILTIWIPSGMVSPGGSINSSLSSLEIDWFSGKERLQFGLGSTAGELSPYTYPTALNALSVLLFSSSKMIKQTLQKLTQI